MVSVSLGGQSARSGTGWTVPRTPDGHPDMQGVWANNSMTPLERPLSFGLRATMTDAELDALKKRATAMMDGGDAFFADELFNAAVEGKTKFKSSDTETGNYDQTWLSERVFDNRTSLIINPPDGRMPALVPEAVERAREQAAAASGQGAGRPGAGFDAWHAVRHIRHTQPQGRVPELLRDHAGTRCLRPEQRDDPRHADLPHRRTDRMCRRRVRQYHGDSRGPLGGRHAGRGHDQLRAERLPPHKHGAAACDREIPARGRGHSSSTTSRSTIP